MASSTCNSPCGACKFLRRKCTQGCVFAPYFPPDNLQKFAIVHRVFGRSNVAKLLSELPHPHRENAVNSLAFEADARLHDPVYGCVGHISILQQKLKLIQDELQMARYELSTYMGPAAFRPFLPPYQSPFHPPPHLSMHGQSASPQMLVREQRRQQLAMVAAVPGREQEIQNVEMGSEGLMFNHQEIGGNGDGGGGTSMMAALPPSGLALLSPTLTQEQFDNPFRIHHQY